MDLKKLLIASLVVNVGLLAIAGFLYMDGSSKGALITDLTNERDTAIEKASATENELKKLQGRLSLIGTNGASDDAERLKKTIDDKDAEISRLKAQLENGGNRPPRGENGRPGRPGGNMQEAMEELKQRNPELYERMQADFERARKDREERNANRERLISGIDSSKLTDKQREVLDKYQDLVKANEDLRASMQEGGDRQDFFKIMQNQNLINSYLTGEIRSILIEQYVDSIRKGSGNAAAEEIRSIIAATSNTNGFFSPGGIGGGPGGFGGGRGGFGGGRGGFGGGPGGNFGGGNR